MLNQNKIDSNQFFYLFLCFSICSKLVNLPSMLANGLGKEAFLGIGVLLLIDLILFLLIFWAYKLVPDLTVFQMFENVLGKNVTKVIALMLSIWILLKLYFGVYSVSKFMIVNLYDSSGWVPLGVPIVLFIVWCAYCGINCIGRTVQIMGPFLLFFLGVGLLLVLSESNFSNLLPMESNLSKIIQATEENLLHTGDTLVFMFLVGKIQPAKNNSKIWIAIALAIGLPFVFNLCFSAFYSNLSFFQIENRVLADMAQKAMGTDSFARLDVPLLISVLIMMIVKLIVYAWVFGQCMENIFGNSSSKAKFMYYLGLVVIYIIIDFLLSKSSNSTVILAYGNYKYILFIPFRVIIPCLVPICAMVCKCKKVESKI